MADTDSDTDSDSTPKQLFRDVSLGGRGATGQDVSIILVPSGGTEDQKLACIRLHSGVLRTHSKYFDTCLSERWNGATSQCKSSPTEFVLEAQAGVESYVDCFSSMYTPLKTFEDVEEALEILKVASQIDFQALMKRISLYLSCRNWRKEDEVRIRAYATCSDFPRSHLEGLVAKLGMDESKEQVCDCIRECTRAVFKACCEKGESFPAYLKGIGRDQSSEFSRMVIGVVTDEAKKMFVNIANEWNGKEFDRNSTTKTNWKVGAMKWILESLLDGGVAEELVQGIIHLNAIPKFAYAAATSAFSTSTSPELSKAVLRIYKEVAAGRLLLTSPERFALLANWCYKSTEFNSAAAELFMTLSMKEQAELVKLRGERVHAYMGKVSLISMVSKLCITD